jgi:hypothetical protein
MTLPEKPVRAATLNLKLTVTVRVEHSIFA